MIANDNKEGQIMEQLLQWFTTPHPFIGDILAITVIVETIYIWHLKKKGG